MKSIVRSMAVLTLGALVAAPLWAGPADEMADQGLSGKEDRVSYSLGRRMGTTIKKQKLEVRIDPFMQGIRDALSDSKSLMTDEEVNATVQAYFKERKERLEREHKELAEQNLKAGKDFLAENAGKEGVVVLPSGLQYKVIESGGGKTPGKNDRVSVHYRGTLIGGKEFGNSYEKGKPVSFAVSQVIPGWVEALQLMKEGDKWQLFIPADLAYGERGRAGKIGPNETLVFEVELLSVEGPKAPPLSALKPTGKATADQGEAGAKDKDRTDEK